MQRSDEWKRKRQLLLSVCGVGEVTTAVLLAELPELGTMSHKKIACLRSIETAVNIEALAQFKADELRCALPYLW